MGHGIKCYKRINKKDSKVILRPVSEAEELYMSYNWSGIEDTLRACFQKDQDQKIADLIIKASFMVRKHMHEKSVKETLANLDAAIDALEKLGVKKGIPDAKNQNWGWGSNMTKSEFCEVFSFHLHSFKNVLEKENQDYYLLSDCCDKNKLSDGSDYEEYYENNEDEQEEDACGDEEEEQEQKQPARIVTYYRDNVKGTMKVACFTDAMYVFHQQKQSGLASADMWLKLAFQMHDAPLYTAQTVSKK